MERRLSNRQRTRQSGYALLLMVVGLMGIGGVVIVGFTQGAKQDTEHERYLHNQRILREAKQALLQYAYNYPVIDDIGPGRLPNADTNNNGLESGGSTFGRLPWANSDLNLYDIRDADGQRLWYAVSSSFSPQAATVNSGTSGRITLRDQSGNVIFDGSNAAGLTQYGVAAVIIAPGAVIDRNGVGQDRSVANSDKPFDSSPDTDPGIITASNYLDLVAGTEDNSGFTNGDATDGLILGPINNLVNDQFVVITAAEVAVMAEKATLQAYRQSIKAYLGNVGCIGGIGATEAICLANSGAWNPVYPWLYNYRDVADKAALSSYYPGFVNFNDEVFDDTVSPSTGYLDNYGRIPSIFADYFTEVDSPAIETRLGGSMTLIDPGAPDTFILTELVCLGACEGTGGTREFGRDPDPDVEAPTLNFESAQILTGVRFVDIDPTTIGDDVRIRASFPAPEFIPFDLYFWGAQNSPTTDWTACPGGANELSDCIFTLGLDRSILHLSGTIDFSGVEDFDFDNTTLPTIAWSRASGASHAWITGTYPASAIISFPGVLSSLVNYEYDGNWLKNETSIDSSDATFATGTVDMTSYSLTSLTLGMRYFPELPSWALSNSWHDSIRMAYADTYLPSLATDCVPLPDADNTNDCLSLPDELGSPSNIASLLVIAGEHDWIDNNADAPVIVGLEDELRDVFDDDNQNNNRSFSTVRGNDRILVIEEL